jgi:hypothetical protein
MEIMVYYETPETEEEFQDLIDLITWPADCNAQPAAMDNILAVVSALKRGWAALQPIRLYVASDATPGLSDWQTAWVSLGYELPISGNVIGLWETITNEVKDSAQYIWIEDDMYPTLARWFNGSSEFIQTTPNMYTNTAALATTYLPLINQPLELKRDAWIEADYGHGFVSNAAGLFLWQVNTIDGATVVRGILASDSPTADALKFGRFTYNSAAKLPQATASLVYNFKLSTGTGGIIKFVNTPQSRKFESGVFPQNSGLVPATVGEISALITEATYL